ncbi:MAG: hypothetical protein KKA76_02195 [Proteobacteria bacterium]|nr:hypothetical protein [Pseudomonadota bacterium]
MDSNEILFCEHYAAAQSLKSVWTRLASTYGCMMIVLSSTTLTIKSHWFAKWAIRLFQLDLFHEIATKNITDFVEKGKWSKYGKVELHFQTVEGKDFKIFLYKKKFRDFFDKATDTIQQCNT